MSFSSKLFFYRPSPPPIVTGQSLDKFGRAFSGLNITDPAKSTYEVQLKYGTAIDQDTRPTLWEEPTSTPGVSDFRELAWDVESECASLGEAVSVLTGDERPIYRANIGFPCASDDVVDCLKRINSPENETDLGLWDWSLELGPIESADLSCEDVFFVGWMAVGISGYGYLWPWTFADLIRRAETHEGIRKLMALCKSMWPIATTVVSSAQLQARKQMGQLWPYPKEVAVGLVLGT